MGHPVRLPNGHAGKRLHPNHLQRAALSKASPPGIAGKTQKVKGTFYIERGMNELSGFLRSRPDSAMIVSPEKLQWLCSDRITLEGQRLHRGVQYLRAVLRDNWNDPANPYFRAMYRHGFVYGWINVSRRKNEPPMRLKYVGERELVEKIKKVKVMDIYHCGVFKKFFVSELCVNDETAFVREEALGQTAEEPEEGAYRNPDEIIHFEDDPGRNKWHKFAALFNVVITVQDRMTDE